MLKLIVSNLRERPTRTFVSVLAISLGVALVLICVGLANGQLTDHSRRTQNVGGDLILQSPNSSHILAIASAAMPEAYVRVIRKIEGVGDATPVLISLDGFSQVFGVNGRAYERFNKNLKFVEGRIFEAEDEAVVDDVYAADKKVAVGDSHTLLAHEFRISGIYRAGTGPRRMMPLSRVQNLIGAPEKCSVIFIRLLDGANIDEVEARLLDKFVNYTIIRSSDLEELWATNTPVVRQFVLAITGIAIVVSFMIILLSMYSTITERTREFGILKSLGASKRYIVQIVLKESLLICVLGVGVGFILTSIGFRLIHLAFPTLPVDTPFEWKLIAPLTAIVSGTIGSIYPALKAARLDPVRALGYE